MFFYTLDCLTPDLRVRISKCQTVFTGSHASAQRRNPKAVMGCQVVDGSRINIARLPQVQFHTVITKFCRQCKCISHFAS